jgi:hypothetical protein
MRSWQRRKPAVDHVDESRSDRLDTSLSTSPLDGAAIAQNADWNSIDVCNSTGMRPPWKMVKASAPGLAEMLALRHHAPTRRMRPNFR